MENPGKEVRNYVNRQIRRLAESPNESSVRADLANLRRGIGKKPGAMPELWAFTLEGLPEQHLSRDGEPTYGEWAIYTALTLFALHQQGTPIKTKCASSDERTFAAAVATIIESDEDLKRIKRRFDATTTAQSMSELSHHARGLIQLFKSSNKGSSFDYPRFAEDLYWYQHPTTRDGVCLRWGQDFYREYGRKYKNNNNNKVEEKNE